MTGTNNRSPAGAADDDDYIELVLATRENTKNVGWLITDSADAIDSTVSIPFYGSVTEGANFPDADWKDEPVVRQAKIRWREDTSISWIERHMEMTQGFIMVGSAPGMLVLGEPTHDREDLTEEERSWPDWSRTKGYIIPAGCGIIIKKGTWHDFPVSVGPEVTAFIINTKEVVDALTSMSAPGSMDFGDCYKRRVDESERASDGRKIRFPDPRAFLQSLGLQSATKTSSKSTWGRWRQSFVSSEHTFRQSFLSDETSQGCVSIQDEKEENPSPSPSTEFFEYGQGMAREEVDHNWGGPNVYVVPVINVESFVPNMFGPSVQPHLNKTQPELANRGWRDYGNKQGLKRLGKLFRQHGISCTAVVSSDLIDKNKKVTSLLNQFKEDDQWEIGAHGKNNSNAGHSSLSKLEEFDSIWTSLKSLGDVFYGQSDHPKTWLTPGFSVTNATPKLLAESGVETLLDFVDDDVPFKLVNEESFGAASPPVSLTGSLVCLPYSMETNDFSLVLTRNLSPREYAAALESHIGQLAKESRESGSPTVVCLGMHTFVAGTPASVFELDKVLTRLKSQGNIKWATAREVTRRVNYPKEGPSQDQAAVPPPPMEVTPGTMQVVSNNLSIRVDKPPCTVQIDRDRVALIMIDFQTDFMCQGGFGEKLGNDISKLRRTIEPTQEVLSAFRRAGLPVIHTREGHRPNLSDVSPLKAGDGSIIGSEGRYGRCMVRGEEGNRIIMELEPLEDGSEPVIDKPGKGAFYQTDLELILKNANIDTLIVCGVTTEICVHMTVREANDRGVQCIVLEDCTASYFDEFHRVGMEMICAQGGILGKVTGSKSVLDGLLAMK